MLMTAKPSAATQRGKLAGLGAERLEEGLGPPCCTAAGLRWSVNAGKLAPVGVLLSPSSIAVSATAVISIFDPNRNGGDGVEYIPVHRAAEVPGLIERVRRAFARD